MQILIITSLLVIFFQSYNVHCQFDNNLVCISRLFLFSPAGTCAIIVKWSQPWAMAMCGVPRCHASRPQSQEQCLCGGWTSQRENFVALACGCWKSGGRRRRKVSDPWNGPELDSTTNTESVLIWTWNIVACLQWGCQLGLHVFLFFFSLYFLWINWINFYFVPPFLSLLMTCCLMILRHLLSCNKQCL